MTMKEWKHNGAQVSKEKVGGAKALGNINHHYAVGLRMVQDTKTKRFTPTKRVA